MTTVAIILIIFGLVLINGVYVAAEFALIGVSKSSIDNMAEEGHGGALRVRAILDNPRQQDRYIAATQLGITFASLGLGMYGEHEVALRLQPWFTEIGGAATAHVVASILAVALMTFLHVVLGEMVPKSMALASPRRAVFATTPIGLATKFVFFPLVVTLEWVSNRIMRLFGIDRTRDESSHHTTEDLIHIVEKSRARGQLRTESGRALSEMFDFSSLKADDVMVARVAMHGLLLGATPKDISQVIKEGQHTRYPVYEEDLDEIVGMVHIRDLLQLLRDWAPLQRAQVRPITFVPETMTLDRVLETMRRDHTHAVIVMDEQGGTAGMLTVKDLFEEVVGTIEEGAVDLEGRVEAFRDDDGRLHVLGTLRVVELAEVLGKDLPDTDAETISGLVLLQLGRPAQVGDTIPHGPVRLVVIAVEGRGVKECLVERV